MYHSAQNTPSVVQSGCVTIYLAVSAPLGTLQGRCAFQNVDPVVMQHTGLPSSGLVEFYVRQVVCVCFYSLCKNMYYTCNIGYTARWAVLPLDSALPFLGCKYLLNDLYNTHRPPLCRVLLAAQFADVIEGAADFLLRPSIVQLSDYTRPDRQWGSQTRPGAWHLNSARGLAILASGLQKVGPEPSSSLLSLSTKGFATFIMMEQYLFSCFNYPFCSFVWYDSKCKLVCFTI